MANRTPVEDWGTLFNFAGDGLVHMEHFGDQQMQRATLQLSNAQILALPTTYRKIILTPGQDKQIAPIAAWLQCTFSNGGYTNIDPDGWLNIEFVSPTDARKEWSQYIGNDSTLSLTYLTDLFDGHDAGFNLQPLSAYQPAAALPLWSLQGGPVYSGGDNSPDNADLILHVNNNGAGDFAGGHADNKLRLDVWYDIIPTIRN